MSNININGKTFSFESGETIVSVAKKNGINIPTMCHNDQCEPFTSCMICVVKDTNSGRLIPSCSIKAEEGMNIETDGGDVYNARKMALELLLSEHGGDCEAPCTVGCPAHLDIPKMMRAIRKKDIQLARDTVFETIPFPSILGRVCPAPCEAVCRRKPYDRGLSICNTKRFIGDETILENWIPDIKSKNGKKIAVIGAGIGGLTVAWYLQINGFSVTIFEKNSGTGGALLDLPADKISPDIIESETDRLVKMGVDFKFNTDVVADDFNNNLTDEFDSVIIASGKASENIASILKVETVDGKVKVAPDGFSTNVYSVYALGSAIKPGRLAVRTVSAARKLSELILSTLTDTNLVKDAYLHKFPRMKKDVVESFIDSVDAISSDSTEKPYLNAMDEAALEAENCLNCDCRKSDGCKLRNYASEYDVNTKTSGIFQDGGVEMKRRYMLDTLVFESSKCIRCGLCVRLSKQLGLDTAFTFTERGYDVEVKLPFNDEPEKGTVENYIKCAEICPTGALSISEFV